MSSPTTRTLEVLRKDGLIAGIVERYNSFIKQRFDFLGMADIICCSPEQGIIAVQCTSGSNHASHKTKILNNLNAKIWLASGGKIFLYSWSKHKIKRGKKAIRWEARCEEIKLEDFV